MYLPAAFNEDRIDVMHAFMRETAFATLVTPTGATLIASHLPLLIDAAPEPFGKLRGHVARANPHWRALAERGESLAIFVGPQSYVSPNWYPSKREHGKVVPTWNYVAVHAYGTARTVEDRDWLRRLVEDLTGLHESGFAAPWRVGDAPPEFIEGMLKGIVGFEIELTRVEGKWKLSQNRPAADRDGTIAGLRQRSDPASLSVAAAMERLREPSP